MESVQEFPTLIDHLAHHVYIDSTKQYISKEMDHKFDNGARERDLR
jgi:hypothetical protein